MSSPHVTADSAAPMVLHVRVVTGTGGGPEKTILNSPRFLRRHGYDSLCAFLHPPGDPGIDDIARRGRLAETEILPIPDRGPFDWRSIRELIRLCRRDRVAIWHGHDYKSNALGLLVRRFHRMRMITTTHGWGAIVGRIPLYNRVDMAVLPYYEHVVCVSQDQAEKCRAAGVRPERITVIDNAIDIEQYRRDPSSEPARAALPCPKAGLLIGSVGRLSREKGYDRLIQAVAELRAQGRDVGLVIAGEGPERGQLEELIARQDRPECFVLLGHQSSMDTVYNAIDIYALASTSEGLPNVLLEAMAMSLPIVATCVGGVPQLLEHDEQALLVPPGDVAALTVALGQLIESPEVAGRLARAARARVEERYSFAHRMRRMVEIYESLGIPGNIVPRSE